MNEFEVTVEASITNTFYVEADNLEEATEKANNMASSHLEEKGVTVNDIEEIDVSEC